jgi:hypothetical protein
MLKKLKNINEKFYSGFYYFCLLIKFRSYIEIW